MLQLIMPTGNRDIPFDICVQLMRNQTYTGPVKWIIVDDIATEKKSIDIPNWEILYELNPVKWKPGENTQHTNLLHCLEFVDRKYPIVFIEDDDYYSPIWLKNVSSLLEKHKIVGEGNAKYYNIATTTCLKLKNKKHASLCSTAINPDLFDELYKILLEKPLYIDEHLWKNKDTSGLQLSNDNLVIGMKGFPGRNGIGMGHRENLPVKDVDFMVLKSWIKNIDFVYQYKTIHEKMNAMI